MRLSLLGLVALAWPALAGAAPQAPKNYFPTEVRAEYVFACMASNGQTPDALRRCSCSIDRIADQIGYDEYAQAETVLRMQLSPSGTDAVNMFRSAPWAQAMVDKLKQAQVQAELQCF